MNQKIRYKLVWCMVALVFTSMSVVSIGSSLSYARQYMNQVDSQTTSILDSATKQLESDIYSIYRATVSLTSKPIFYEVCHANQGTQIDSNFPRHYQQLADLFNVFTFNTKFVENIALLCPNGAFYSTYNVGLNYQIQQFEQELSQTSISWLPLQQNPMLYSSSSVVPVCFPLKETGSKLRFCTNESPDMTLVLYLNLEMLEKALHQVSSISYTNIFLTDGNGCPITVDPAFPLYSAFTQESFGEKISACSERQSFDTTLDGQNFRVTSQKITGSDLYMVIVFPYQQMQNSALKILKITALVILLTIPFMIILVFFVSSTITVPLRNLLKQVDKVRTGRYQLTPVTHYNDELHEMDLALCNMGNTIDQQICTIRSEEKMRRKAELTAISEQINQHFLYNTLDCIHWDILNNHPENAANMVESLGQFLRISLNQGKELLDCSQALQHTQQYINIMNIRFGSDIRFFYTIVPELQHYLIPKSIFQPLVENSILHGFGGSTGDPAVITPTIDIKCRVEKDTILLSIIDNGCGFDPAAMEDMLNKPSSHVGLYNVSKRLNYVFGNDVRFSFSSTPYYRNEICIHFPFRESPETDEA